MNKKVVCHYCGKVFDASEGKCPVCQSTKFRPATEADMYVKRHRLTEQERKQRKKEMKHEGKEEYSKKTKAMMITAFVLLSLTVVVLTWFIGDMIGWWPGFEDLVNREDTSANIEINNQCSMMDLSEKSLHFSKPGEQAEIKFSINKDCTEDIEIFFPDVSVVTAEFKGDTEKSGETKTDTLLITSVAAGTTQLAFRCNDLSQVCDITVD